MFGSARSLVRNGMAYELLGLRVGGETLYQATKNDLSWHQNGASRDKTTIASLRQDVAIFLDRHQYDTSQVRLVSKGSTYTRLWNHVDWQMHLSVSRYARHVYLWPTSTIAWRIFPVCCAVAGWALAVKEISKRGVRLELPFACGILFGQAITLLLTLRTNQSLARVQEARAVFNKVVVSCRELASLASVYVHHEVLAVLLARYVALFPWSLKRTVRGDKDEAELKLMYRELLPSLQDVTFIETSASAPLALVRRMRQVLAAAVAAGVADRCVQRTIEIKLGALNDLCGDSEKILRSPSPPAYTRHTSRVLLVFLLMVPMGLTGLDLPVHFLVIASAFTTYLLVGIEEIGVELEEPFRWLPLHELCTQLVIEVVDEFSDAPPLPIKNDSSLDDVAGT